VRTERKFAAAACVFFLLTMLTACEREDRRFREPAPSSGATSGLTVSGLHPADPTKGTNQPPPEWVQNPYADNAYAVSEGQKLYDAYNCSGCHFHGGGGIGPPLMDNTWTYGSEPQNIYADIVEGRPNGMPSFRGKIPDQQVWEIVAFVRSMSGQLSKDVAPGRSDEMQGGNPPSSTPHEQPHGPEGVHPK
jgi:cytochrome c oxidase cbb3-type subunit 3